MAILTSAAPPRIAVLIPVYNDPAGLERSLASLAASVPFEVIVVDDGSTPPVVPPAAPFRVRVVRLARNQGIVGALNAGLDAIRAAGHYAYVARLDAGDRSHPGRLTAQLAFLDRHPDHAVVGTWAELVDPAGRRLFEFRPPVEHARLLHFLRYRAGLVHASVMIRLAALGAHGGYNPRFAGAEDVELWLRLGAHHRLANIGQVLHVREVAPRSITARRHRVLWQRLRVLLHHFDRRAPAAYLGVLTNAALLLAPRGAVLQLRRALDGWWRNRAQGKHLQQER